MTHPQPRHEPTRPLPPLSAAPAGPYLPALHYPPPVVITAAPTSGTATAAMVLGIIGVLGGWCVFGLPCILAVILGHVGLHETREGRKAGRGMAVAGLVLGYVFVVPMITLTVMMFFGSVLGASTPTP
ncbi:DUF4190 domain-containing protein [Micromonospora sp. CPCC 205711]|uniref:DUF4190 domain-containing protein n=1 Tax=Micromonospora sp. CPCC 205547 TaxID=3122400 RepID=UPI002FF408DC